MPDDLRNRLRKLGIQKGARNLTPKPKPKRLSAIESLIDGEIIETDYGPVFVHVERYAPDHFHGAYPLGELLSQSRLVAGRLADLDEESISNGWPSSTPRPRALRVARARWRFSSA